MSFVSQQSIMYSECDSFDALDSIDQLISYKDKAGNTAAHHCAFMGLKKSLAALVSCGAKAWGQNLALVPPVAIADGVATIPFPAYIKSAATTTDHVIQIPSGEVVCVDLRDDVAGREGLPWPKLDPLSAQLYRSLRRRNLLPIPLVRLAFQTPRGYDSPDYLSPLVEAMFDMKKVSYEVQRLLILFG